MPRASCLLEVPQKRRRCQPCTNRNYSRPVEAHERTHRAGHFIPRRKPPNKADAALCWCGTRMAGIHWPDQWVRAARLSTTVTPAATRPLGSRRQSAVASTSQRWPAVIRPLTSMSGPRVRQDKSMPALPRPDGICRATTPAATTSFFCLRLA